MSVFIDLITIGLAFYVLIQSSYRITTNPQRYWPLVFISGLYLIAQTGWTASFLAGNFIGMELNNYIWFLFNTTVFCVIIRDIGDGD